MQIVEFVEKGAAAKTIAGLVFISGKDKGFIVGADGLIDGYRLATPCQWMRGAEVERVAQRRRERAVGAQPEVVKVRQRVHARGLVRGDVGARAQEQPRQRQAGGDNGAHRGAADEIDRDVPLAQGADRADMGIGARAAARQHQADARRFFSP